LEKYHAQIMYSRHRNNQYPDTDPESFSFWCQSFCSRRETDKLSRNFALCSECSAGSLRTYYEKPSVTAQSPSVGKSLFVNVLYCQPAGFVQFQRLSCTKLADSQYSLRLAI
jgi:hypothetical protein